MFIFRPTNESNCLAANCRKSNTYRFRTFDTNFEKFNKRFKIESRICHTKQLQEKKNELCKCENIKGETKSRIINGTKVLSNDLPFVASLIEKKTTGKTLSFTLIYFNLLSQYFSSSIERYLVTRRYYKR